MKDLITSLKGSVTVEFADRVRSVIASGRDIACLQTGDPEGAPHQNILKVISQAVARGDTHYCSSRGLLSLRIAISEKLKITNSISSNPASEILITNGAVHGLYLALQALVNPGDEVIITSPYWMPYLSATRLAGGIPVIVPTQEGVFAPQIEILEKFINDKTKVLILNSPSNPAGVILSAEHLRKIVELSIAHNVKIISDEVYERILMDSRSIFSPASNESFRENIVTLFSFSKTYAMTGFRIGYVVAAAETITQMLKVLQYTVTSLPPFVQQSALTALTDPAVDTWVDENERIYRRRLDNVRAELGESEAIHYPNGAFYILFRSATNATGYLMKRGVAFAPGSAFGLVEKGWLRMTLAASDNDINRGIEAIRKEGLGP